MPNNHWTEKEINILKTHYCDKKIHELMELLTDRSEYSIRTKARDLKLKKEPNNYFWSEEEIEILKDNYQKSNKELTNFLPGRTTNSIQKKKENLELKNSKFIRQRNDYWADEEIQILKDNYKKESIEKILELLPKRTLRAVRTKVVELKLTNERDFWADEEIQILKDNYQNKSIEDLMKLLPERTENTIRAYASKLNLTTKLKHWSKEEIELLRKYYKTESFDELTKRFVNRTAKSIVLKANSLGLTKD
jgi:arsenate reductase-like glutaredoxin family protein